MNTIKNQPHIVVVDESKDTQERLQSYFVTKGYVVSNYSDAQTAIDECRRNGRTWDVILSDLHLSTMSDVNFTKNIKSLQPDLPIIIITPLQSAEVAAEIVTNGAYDFILAPIIFPQVLVAVERALKLKAMSVDLEILREQVKFAIPLPKGIIGKSPKFIAALDVARRVAKSKTNIFLSGESGTGKEVFARFIHNEGVTAKGPFIAINCSAIPENLLESELFGHAKGAFTGANDKKIGLFEAAENGTLFLDEIGDLSLSLQAKLLRVLQEKKIKRVGENQFRDINARVISATHKNLAEEIQSGNFREDLFYRLSVIPIALPPLRNRVEDIIPLAEYFLKKYSVENSSPARSFSKSAVKYLLENNWRGNVRELENSVERAVVLASISEVQATDFSISILDGVKNITIDAEIADIHKFTYKFEKDLPTLEQVTQKYIEFAVSYYGGAKDSTAKAIGIDRKTLYKKLQAETQTLNRN